MVLDFAGTAIRKFLCKKSDSMKSCYTKGVFLVKNKSDNFRSGCAHKLFFSFDSCLVNFPYCRPRPWIALLPQRSWSKFDCECVTGSFKICSVKF